MNDEYFTIHRFRANGIHRVIEKRKAKKYQQFNHRIL
jgi:hypothetical protein